MTVEAEAESSLDISPMPSRQLPCIHPTHHMHTSRRCRSVLWICSQSRTSCIVCAKQRMTGLKMLLERKQLKSGWAKEGESSENQQPPTRSSATGRMERKRCSNISGARRTLPADHTRCSLINRGCQRGVTWHEETDIPESDELSTA